MAHVSHDASGTDRRRAAAQSPCADAGLPVPPAGVIQDLTERIGRLEAANDVLRTEAETFGFHLAEVEHRLMNSFGVIRALVNATARPGDTGDGFRMSFVPRLMALAQSHAVLRSDRSGDSTLDEVVRRCLSPHSEDQGRVAVLGPVVALLAPHVPMLGLAFHELATNAIKYGALSVPAGRIDVTWTVRVQDSDQTSLVEILWREWDGPPVRAPERRGFGTLLLERGLDIKRGGAVRLDFAPGGLQCLIRMPLAPA